MTNPASPPTVTAPERRHSTGVVVGAGLVGLALGAIGAFAITGLVFTVRVELPPPPYPQVLPSTPPAPPPAGTAPMSTPSLIPMPPLPTGPH